MQLKTFFLLLFLPWLARAQKPNVLLLLVDDLKPAMGCYGDKHAITPAMDALAKRGMRFDLAYCNQTVCAPSRFTMMLGSHSTSTGLYGLGSQLRQVLPNAVTMRSILRSTVTILNRWVRCFISAMVISVIPSLSVSLIFMTR